MCLGPAPNGDKGFLPLAGILRDGSSPSPAADTQTSDVTDDAISTQTTHEGYCHWTAINSLARMFYAQTMYFRYIRTAKYYRQSSDCPLVILSPTGIAKFLLCTISPQSPAALSIIDPFRPLLIIVILHLVAVLNNLYLWYCLQTYQCPLPPPC
jgi:hypothetical protein